MFEEFKDYSINALFKMFLCWQPIDFCELVDFNMSSVLEFLTVPDASVPGQLNIFHVIYII